MTADTHALFPGKAFISTILEALDTKTAMSGGMTRRYLQRAAMAGVIIGLFYATNFAAIAAITSIGGDPSVLRPLGKIVGSLIFGWALVFIYYTKSELLTSNMMIVSIGGYHRRTSWTKALRLLGYCFLGNAIGGLFVAVLLRFSTITSEPILEEMRYSVEHKLAYVTDGFTGMTDLFLRAILCNFLINIAMLLVYNGLIKDDLTKSLVMIMAVFMFAFLGLDHSVANTVLFTIIGLRDGIDVGLAAANVGIALLGNFIGGGVLIGLYYAYVNDDRRYAPTRDETDAVE